ncbi:MAG: hypothetical protein AB2L11_08070 [Syntrophobacteraceae bacterium]
MKRIMVVFMMLAFAFTVISGCACGQKNKCEELCQSALDKAQSVEQSCASYAKQAEAAAQRAEAAARRAEAAADKAEAAFKKHLKK